MWNLRDDLEFIRALGVLTAFAGWYVCIGGGVLHRGHSDHDLDLVFVPHYRAKLSDLHRVLHNERWALVRNATAMRAGWALPDKKHVEEWRTPDGRRVDVIVLLTEDQICLS